MYIKLNISQTLNKISSIYRDIPENSLGKLKGIRNNICKIKLHITKTKLVLL